MKYVHGSTELGMYWKGMGVNGMKGGMINTCTLCSVDRIFVEEIYVCECGLLDVW